MRRMLQRLVPALLLGGLGLVWSGWLDARIVLLLGGVVEMLVLAFGVVSVTRIFVRYRRNRDAGLNLAAALEDGLAVLLPRPLARVVVLEPRLWICLYRWLFRRRPPAGDAFGYSKRSMMGAFVVLIVLTAPFETLAYELLIPWAVVRWLLLIATLYGSLWILSLFASLQVLPHRLTDAGLVVHYGLLAEGTIAYTSVADVVIERRKAPDGKEGLRVIGGQQAAYLAVGGRTDVTLSLREPLVLHGLLRPTPPVTTLYLAVDDPAALAQALRARSGLYLQAGALATSPLSQPAIPLGTI